MTDIAITALDPGHYGVEVTEGDLTTGHRVAVPDDFALDLGVVDVSDEALVRESIGFLLEREPATAILSEFALPDIADHFPDYAVELRARLGGEPPPL
jgi:hypothetical protein